jgi:hypothetical protein
MTLIIGSIVCIVVIFGLMLLDPVFFPGMDDE